MELDLGADETQWRPRSDGTRGRRKDTRTAKPTDQKALHLSASMRVLRFHYARPTLGSSAVSAAAQQRAPTPAPGASASKATLSGQYSIEAERVARHCASKPRAALVARGAGFETYTVKCDNGDALAVRCARRCARRAM